MSSSKRKSESDINNLAFDVNSDSETDVYWDSDESANLSSDEFSSDSDVSDSESVDVADARVCVVWTLQVHLRPHHVFLLPETEDCKSHLLNAACSVVKSPWEKEVQKPAAVLHYNHTMEGVDKVDQELTFYPVMGKATEAILQENFQASAGTMSVECIRAVCAKQ